MPQPESLIKNEILQWLNLQRGVFAWSNFNGGVYDPKVGRFRKHNSKFSIKGLPDILGVIDRPGMRGKLIAIEVKTPTGRLSPAQAFVLTHLEVHGAISFMARSVDEVRTRLADILAQSAVLSGGERRVNDDYWPNPHPEKKTRPGAS